MMRSKPLVAAATLGAAFAALLCAGCDSAKKPVDALPPSANAAEPSKQASAYEMVTQSEVSAILGEVKLIFSGVDDAPAKAKKIFQTAKPRLSP
jgi:uncharacterized lipoprotein YmbA